MAAQTTLEQPFQPDLHLTEVMRQRVQSLQQRGGKRQDGERLLRPHKAVYHLDFSQQALHFTHWGVRLDSCPLGWKKDNTSTPPLPCLNRFLPSTLIHLFFFMSSVLTWYDRHQNITQNLVLDCNMSFSTVYFR
uniref:Uncharacterized protein n=1 Tax=Hucho hucho TaxID=62062 RepID=A0A4W5NKY8_9TELE